MSDRAALLKGIRAWLVVFVVGLVLSGATAFPLVHELRWTEDLLGRCPCRSTCPR